MKTRHPSRAVGLLLAGIFLGLTARVAAKPAPPSHSLDVGTYRIEVTPPKNWQSDVKPELGCVLFQYTDRPAMTTAATIGVFRIVVPAAARGADRAELASAYATHDMSGAQQSLFKSNAQLMRMGKKTLTLAGGQVFGFAELLDAKDARLSSSKFTRAWVFFPKSYDQDGGIFLVLGKQETPVDEVRPSELLWVEDILAGIRGH